MRVRHAYVYYRVAPGRAAHAAARIERLLASMARHCSTPPRRLVRCDDATTWMEIYEGIADWPAFEAALNAQHEALALAGLLDGPRQLECFAAPASP